MNIDHFFRRKQKVSNGLSERFRDSIFTLLAERLIDSSFNFVMVFFELRVLLMHFMFGDVKNDVLRRFRNYIHNISRFYLGKSLVQIRLLRSVLLFFCNLLIILLLLHLFKQSFQVLNLLIPVRVFFLIALLFLSVIFVLFLLLLFVLVFVLLFVLLLRLLLLFFVLFLVI